MNSKIKDLVEHLNKVTAEGTFVHTCVVLPSGMKYSMITTAEMADKPFSYPHQFLEIMRANPKAMCAGGATLEDANNALVKRIESIETIPSVRSYAEGLIRFIKHKGIEQWIPGINMRPPEPKEYENSVAAVCLEAEEDVAYLKGYRVMSGSNRYSGGIWAALLHGDDAGEIADNLHDEDQWMDVLDHPLFPGVKARTIHEALTALYEKCKTIEVTDEWKDTINSVELLLKKHNQYSDNAHGAVGFLNIYAQALKDKENV